jgi:hypothetical protein
MEAQENRFWTRIFCIPKRIIVKILGFEDRGEHRVFRSSNHPSRMKHQTTTSYWLANVIPRSKMKGFRRVFILNFLPPKRFKNGIDFLYEGFWQKDILPEIDRNGSKKRIDISDTTSMIKFIGFKTNACIIPTW